MKVVLLDEAQRRFEAEDAWWREHRDAKELFVDEFARAVATLSFMPGVGKRYRLARGAHPARAHAEDRLSRVLLP